MLHTILVMPVSFPHISSLISNSRQFLAFAFALCRTWFEYIEFIAIVFLRTLASSSAFYSVSTQERLHFQHAWSCSVVLACMSALQVTLSLAPYIWSP